MAVLGIAVDLPSPQSCGHCMSSDPYRRAARQLPTPAGLACAQTGDVPGGLRPADAVASQRPQKWKDRGVSEWIFFMHPPRDDFIATMSGAERAAFDAHAAWLRGLLADGLLIAAGPCLGQINTGIAIFEAASEEEARRIVAGEPVTSGEYMRGDLRPFRLGLLRGRDNAARDRPAQPVSSQPAHPPGTGLPPLLALGQDRPGVSGTAFVAPSAMLIGRVTIGEQASVWYGAVLRADRDAIVVGERSNVQDGCVLHADPGVPLSVGSDVTIGHNATLHGCTVEDLVLIGMGAIVLNGARVGRHAIIAAGTVLAEGQQVPEGVLVAGVPGKVRRDLSQEERAAIERNAATYVGLSRLHRRGEA
jgi:carbonic anhydrase/acetyltransferase-like protein (isoleucine patch superfamily)/uncharacterized protein YciI